MSTVPITLLLHLQLTELWLPFSGATWSCQGQLRAPSLILNKFNWKTFWMFPASDANGQICPRGAPGREREREGVRVAAATKATNAYEIVANLQSQSQSTWSFYWDCLFVAIHLRTVWHLVSGLTFFACTLPRILCGLLLPIGYFDSFSIFKPNSSFFFPSFVI